MRLLDFVFLALSSLFVIVDPIATVPAFIAMTPKETPEQRIAMAQLACTVMAVVLLFFAISGQWLFKLFGITLPAFQIAGSIVLLLIALDMLRAQRSRVQETREETAAGVEKDDIAITPLAIPMLAGPGAISTAILLRNQANGWVQQISLYLCILMVAAITYLIFRISAHGMRWLNPIAMKITTRIMGLILASVAVQFILNALKDLKGTLF
jgi:multiple antibiotic resistance protein